MTYGIKYKKDGSEVGYLHFKGDKAIYLNAEELSEFKQKIRDWQYQAVEQYIVSCFKKDSLVNKEV